MAVTKENKNFSIDKEILEALKSYSTETDVPESRVVNKLLREFFESKKLPRKKIKTD